MITHLTVGYWARSASRHHSRCDLQNDFMADSIIPLVSSLFSGSGVTSFKLGSWCYSGYQSFASFDGSGVRDDRWSSTAQTINLSKYKYSIVVWCLHNMRPQVDIDSVDIGAPTIFNHSFSTRDEINMMLAECTYEINHLHIRFYRNPFSSPIEHDAYTQFYPFGYGGFALIPAK